MEKMELVAQKRERRGKGVQELRNQGMIPAILYGHRQEPIALQIEERSLSKVVSEAGTHHLINLMIDGQETKNVLVKEIQRHPVKGNILHLDLYAVIMSEKIHTKIPLIFTGTPPVVARKEGILVHGLSEIEIECLPGDLIESISVDVSGLTEINQTINVVDLSVDRGIEVLTGKEDMVAKILPVVEEVVEEAVPAALPEEVEVIAKGKVEEEEAPSEEET
ncbi:MAG: 50S ribosomal protein L25 [Chloroflexi bacterium]|nr:50S ribosomal protein L25 [Chloroflexota bacterium]